MKHNLNIREIYFKNSQLSDACNTHFAICTSIAKPNHMQSILINFISKY